MAETSPALESERLAMRYFELFSDHALGELAELIHADVVLELQAVEVGRVLRGRAELLGFFEEQFRHRRWDAIVHACHSVGDDKVIVEGRIHWIDDERVMRDDRRVWALEFCDGRLLRSIPSRSVAEAQAVLSTSGKRAP